LRSKVHKSPLERRGLSAALRALNAKSISLSLQ
jgi:hypothetical protein